MILNLKLLGVNIMSVISNVLPDIKMLESLEDAILLEKEKRLQASNANKEIIGQIKVMAILLSFSQSKMI